MALKTQEKIHNTKFQFFRYSNSYVQFLFNNTKYKTKQKGNMEGEKRLLDFTCSSHWYKTTKVKKV